MSGLRGIKTTRTSKKRDELRASNGNRIVDTVQEAVQFETLRTHARAIVEGEGAEEFSPALVEAVISTLGEELYDLTGHTLLDASERQIARAILSTIRKHQAGE